MAAALPEGQKLSEAFDIRVRVDSFATEAPLRHKQHSHIQSLSRAQHSIRLD